MNMLTLDQFADSVGETYEVAVGDATVPLRLEEAAASAWADTRQGGAFRLEWSGPADAMLPQATYLIRHGGRELAIMIVPIARSGDEIRYEAIFN